MSGRAPGACALAALGLACVNAAPAAAQTPPTPIPPPKLELDGPRVVATGVAFTVEGRGAPPDTRVLIEVAVDGRWRLLSRSVADNIGEFDRRVRPEKPRRRYLLRARSSDGRLSKRIAVRTRNVTLASVGDINLGNGPGVYIDRFGVRYPWTSVAPALRRADVAFGNLECAVSTRGLSRAKAVRLPWPAAGAQSNGRLRRLRRAQPGQQPRGRLRHGRHARHDQARASQRDDARWARVAAWPRQRRRGWSSGWGCKIAFVGFSDILPASFFAGPDRAGTQQATPENIASSVRRASRRADVVIATFHWGVERATVEDARQRGFASQALAAGADAVIGAHPHVLQPIRRNGRKLTAYSLGNFVFGAGSPGTSSTGILELGLSTRGVERSRFRRAVISATRPVLR